MPAFDDFLRYLINYQANHRAYVAATTPFDIAESAEALDESKKRVREAFGNAVEEYLKREGYELKRRLGDRETGPG